MTPASACGCCGQVLGVSQQTVAQKGNYRPHIKLDGQGVGTRPWELQLLNPRATLQGSRGPSQPSLGKFHPLPGGPLGPQSCRRVRAEAQPPALQATVGAAAQGFCPFKISIHFCLTAR